MFDAILIELPLDSGIEQSLLLELLEMFKSDVELVTLRAAGETSFAYGFVTFDAINNKIDKGMGETHLEEKISEILKDTNLTNKEETYNLLGLECVITTDLYSVIDRIIGGEHVPIIQNLLSAYTKLKENECAETKKEYEDTFDNAYVELSKYGETMPTLATALARIDRLDVFMERYKDRSEIREEAEDHLRFADKEEK